VPRQMHARRLNNVATMLGHSRGWLPSNSSSRGYQQRTSASAPTAAIAAVAISPATGFASPPPPAAPVRVTAVMMPAVDVASGCIRWCAEQGNGLRPGHAALVPCPGGIMATSAAVFRPPLACCWPAAWLCRLSRAAPCPPAGFAASLGGPPARSSAGRMPAWSPPQQGRVSVGRHPHITACHARCVCVGSSRKAQPPPTPPRQQRPVGRHTRGSRCRPSCVHATYMYGSAKQPAIQRRARWLRGRPPGSAARVAAIFLPNTG
jgi:hypothetical protein